MPFDRGTGIFRNSGEQIVILPWAAVVRDEFVQGVATLLLARQIEHGQLFAQDQVIVCGDPAVAHLATAETLMHDHLLAIPPKRGADGLHQTAALVLAVARGVVDMFRVEAKRAMVPLAAAADRRTDEGLAMPAFELFQLGLSQGRRVVDAFLPATG